MIGTFIALAASNVAAAAQVSAAQTCTLPLIADRVELKPVPGSNLMTVPVTINGTQKQFLLDIAAKPDEVSQATVAELHLPQSNQSTDSLPLVPGVMQRSATQSMQLQAATLDLGGTRTVSDYPARIRVASFTIGGATTHNLQFVIANDREMEKSEPYDGRLTAGFFSQYDIDFDFGGKQLSFLTRTSCPDPDQAVYWPHTEVAVIPMTIRNGAINVQVTIQGHIINAVIDTGSAQTVMRRDIAELTLGFKPDTPDMMPDGDIRDGRGEHVYRHTFSQISFAGGVTANNVPASIQTNSMLRDMDRTPILGSRALFEAGNSQRIPDLALGMDMLHQLHLYAAFGEKELFVTSAE
jgi:predicted aspartyl protease